ncbi:MAG: hypothetical protein ACOYM8_15755 [Caulobacterales bacterium]
MTPKDRAALKPLARAGRDRAALCALFEVIRRTDDDALLAVLTAPTRPRPQPADLAADVRARLAPLLASAQEKADALAVAMARVAGDRPIEARGLTAMARALAARYGDDAVRAAAAALMAEIAAAAGREGPP